MRGYLAGRAREAAARVGGRRVWGDYPWHEAAFIGGSRDVRGYRKNRYAGDASLYGNLEPRLWLFRGTLIAPGRWGVFGLGTSAASSSRRTHRQVAPGVRRGPLLPDADPRLDRPRRDGGGEEDRRLYVDYGFAF